MKEKVKNVLTTILSIVIIIGISILSIPLAGNKRRNNEVSQSSPILWLFLSPKMLNSYESKSNTKIDNSYNIKIDQEKKTDTYDYSRLYAINWLNNNIEVFKESVSSWSERYNSIDCSISKKAICPTIKTTVWKILDNEIEILSFYELTNDYINNNSYDKMDTKYFWTIVELFKNRINLYKSLSEITYGKCDEYCENFVEENQKYIDNYEQFIDLYKKYTNN